MSIEAKPNRPTFVTRIVDGCDLRKSPSSIVSKLLELHMSLMQKNRYVLHQNLMIRCDIIQYPIPVLGRYFILGAC